MSLVGQASRLPIAREGGTGLEAGALTRRASSTAPRSMYTSPMRLFALLAVLLLALPARANDPPAACLWINPLLPAAPDAAAEARVFEHTLARSLELLIPLDDAARRAIALAAAKFASRQPLHLTMSNLDAAMPVIEPSEAGDPPAFPAAAAHRAWLAKEPGGDLGVPVLELFIDVNAVRRANEGEPDGGRAARVLRAMHLANARSLMLHARLIPPDQVAMVDPTTPLPPSARRLGEYQQQGDGKAAPLVRIDLSWNSRADDLKTVRGVNIAAGHWPARALPMDPPRAAFACVFRADYRAWLEGALSLRSAWLEPRAAVEFDATRSQWLRRNRTAVDRLTGSLPAWCVLTPEAQRPDTLGVASRPRDDGLSAQKWLSEFDKLLRADFNAHLPVIPDGGTTFIAASTWPIRQVGWNHMAHLRVRDVRLELRLRGGPFDPAIEER